MLLPVARSEREKKDKSLNRRVKPLEPYPLSPVPSPSSAPTPHQAPPVFDSGQPMAVEYDQPPRQAGPWLSMGLLAGGAAALFILSVRNAYLLGQVASLILALGGLHGLWRGALRKMVMLPVLIGVVYLVTSQVDFADPVIRLMAGKSSVIGNGIACALAIVLTLTVVGNIVKSVRDRIARKHPHLLTADRLLGTGIGLAEGAFVVLCLCWTAVLVQPQVKTMRNQQVSGMGLFQRGLTTGLVQLVDEIDRGPLRPIVREINLLERIPSLRDLIHDLSAGSLDPRLNRRVTEFLQQSDSDEPTDTKTLFKEYRRGNRTRDKAYRQLPPPRNGDR